MMQIYRFSELKNMSYTIRALCLFVIGIQLVVLTQCAPIEAFGVEETSKSTYLLLS